MMMTMMINSGGQQPYLQKLRTPDEVTLNQLQALSNNPQNVVKIEAHAPASSPVTVKSETSTPKAKKYEENIEENPTEDEDRSEIALKDTQEIIFAHNPKVYHQATKEWLILARENKTGRLAWVSANSGMVFSINQKNHPKKF